MPDHVAVIGRPPLAVIGVAGDTLAKEAARALEGADLVVGGRRHLDAFAPSGARRMVIEGDVAAVLDAVGAEPGRVCLLASGDPGFFGIVRALTERFGSRSLTVHPGPSSVSLAFARLGLPWDDAVVVSAHGRPLPDAARRVAAAPKAAVLTSPDSPPEALGRELLALGARHRRVAVCSRLGSSEEQVRVVDLDGLASGSWDPLSVVVLVDREVSARPVLAWGLAETEFAHRQGMITKAEVRAVALGKLALPPAGVLWDVGAGSGSVAVECARLAPALRVVAVERDPDQVARLRDNAARHQVAVEVTQGAAPAALAGLPDPDRAFVGGGRTDVLDAVLARLRPGGVVVATYAALDRAAMAFGRLGNVVEVAVNRGVALADGGVRLAAGNPVFIAWGGRS
ncbi:MAG: precorrin-6y C5,15-methyltransferase (decarboxylating) subunit CbiE [Actinomycetota bacterium]|nr:precorrin-6y C5,15-methyltransferase (decarboxylating) subunit CbiE [Actinomycetota bacterium]